MENAALSRLLHPVSVQEFLNDYAGQSAMLIKGQDDRFADLGFDIEAFFSSAEAFTANEDRIKVAIKGEEFAEAYKSVDPGSARAAYQSGHTVCVAGISDAHPELGQFAEAVRLGLSIPDLRFNSYLSPDGSGFNLHYDAQPIFLLQMAGSKRWWYGKHPITPAPTRYSASWPEAEKPSLQELESTLLEPGDVLYLPAFCWHRARAEGFSLGATLGTKGHHNQPLREALQRAGVTNALPAGPLQPPICASQAERGIPGAAQEYLEAQLSAIKNLADQLTVDDLWRYWLDEVQIPKAPVGEREEIEMYSTDRVRRGTPYSVLVERRLHADGHEVTEVRHAGMKLILPGQAYDLACSLRECDAWTTVGEIRERAPGLTRAEIKRYVRELVCIRVLAREE